MAQSLGNVAVGSTVYLNENGSPQPYLVVHQGLPSSLYDASCSGTWLLRTNIYTNRQFNSSNKNYYDTASISNDYLSKLLSIYESSIQSLIKNIKIPYYRGKLYSGSNGFSCKLFLLSGMEVGYSSLSNLPQDGAKLNYFEVGETSSANNKRISNYNSSPNSWWLRSPDINGSAYVWNVGQTGELSSSAAALKSVGVRYAIVMPQGLVVDDSNNITSTQIPWPFPTVSSLTAPSIAMQGQSIPLSWTPVSVSGFNVTYQLQRNADNGGWTTIYTGANTSYTDTAGTWTQVQYQVAAVINGAIGSYTQSSIIPVSDPQALVISGSDGNLGTLASNVPYTVSSNTGNPISLTRTVNGAQVVTLTVDSGFAYNIPIADLPTGTGTIQITASVEISSETVTQTRTWTYYKTPINISSTGGIAQLTQNGQNIWPVTVPDAVEAPVYLGGNLNAALNKLGQAALYTKIGSPKYNQVTVDLSKVKVGDEVLLPENGVMVPFVVGNLNYEPTLNTSGNRVLLVRKNAYQTGQWNSSNVNTYANSTVDTWLNGTYKNLLGQEVQDSIGTTTFKYTPGNGNWTVTTLSKSVFLLSFTELGRSGVNINVEGSSLPISNILQNFDQWTRSPATNDNSYVWFLRGGSNTNYYTQANTNYAYRPCFTLPTTFNQTYYVDSSNNIHLAQEYTQGGSITDVFGYDVPICQYETGSYTGTGTFGSSNPNSLIFSFKPKLVFIICTDTSLSSTNLYQTNALIYGSTKGGAVPILGTNTEELTLNWGNNSLSYYSDSAFDQLNLNNTPYSYIAIG